MVVVLPAPLGPTKPTTCPEEKSNETSSTARVRPKCFFRLTTSIFIYRLRIDSPVRAPERHKRPSAPCARHSRANLLRETNSNQAWPDNNRLQARPGDSADTF